MPIMSRPSVQPMRGKSLQKSSVADCMACFARSGDSGKLTGILNGAGEEWTPERDKSLIQTYPPRIKEGKQRNAAWLRETTGLQKSNRPLFVMVSRLVHQKGVDLALAAVETIAAGGGQFFLLGEGEPALEKLATDTVTRFPGSAAANIAFDEFSPAAQSRVAIFI